MPIHHINCGTDCPLGGAFFDGRSKGPLAHLVCHCLLVETPSSGLVLVDTGYGMKDVEDPFPERISPPFAAMLNIRLRERETALRQIERLGYSARDVRHIVITHLDFVHAGGLEDFPEAKVHLTATELEAFHSRREGFVGKNRYRPVQVNNVKNWRTYNASGEPWFGFEAVRQMEGLPPEILLVPLRGHTWGHAGVALHSGSGWLLHAGDAYFYRGEVRHPDRRCTPVPAALSEHDGSRSRLPPGKPAPAAATLPRRLGRSQDDLRPRRSGARSRSGWPSTLKIRVRSPPV